jgi:hypothetical protein
MTTFQTLPILGVTNHTLQELEKALRRRATDTMSTPPVMSSVAA